MEKIAENLIYDIWYTICERLFKKIVEECGLNQEQEEALWIVLMRPNDYRILITS
jgi:hypothetical protein